MGKYLTENEKRQIISLHLENKSTVEISKLIHRNQSTIERYLKKNNYKMTYGSRITQEQKEEIINLYINGMTCKEIYKNFSYIYKSEEAIQKIIRNANVSRGRYIKPTYHNDNYFENIDSERKAYWIGLLLADGCIVEKQNESNILKLELNNGDRYIIKEFAKDIKTDLCVRDYKYGEKHNAILQIHSDKLCHDLSKFGIVPRKTLIIESVPNIPQNLIRHFIRGYFDGDGCIYLAKPKNQYIHRANITFCGTEKFLLNLKSVISDQTQLETGSVIDMNKYGSNVFNLRYSRNHDVKILYNYMYKNATIFLNRKKEKFEIFLNERK